MMVTTMPSEGIITGSSLYLMCIIELSSAVDIPVIVNVHWTGPYFDNNNIGSIAGSLNVYTSTATVDAARDGNYTCRTTVSSSSQFITDRETMSHSTSVITGESIR